MNDALRKSLDRIDAISVEEFLAFLREGEPGPISYLMNAGAL